MGLMFASCKGSKESAYKKAYEKAQEREVANAAGQDEVQVVTPVAPVETTAPVQVATVDNEPVRNEGVQLIDGAGLKAYSVVVGSFSVLTNAQGMQQRLKDQGYAAQIVKNTERNMYRVVSATFDNKQDAVSSRNQIRGSYADAWLLMNK